MATITPEDMAGPKFPSVSNVLGTSHGCASRNMHMQGTQRGAKPGSKAQNRCHRYRLTERAMFAYLCSRTFGIPRQQSILTFVSLHPHQHSPIIPPSLPPHHPPLHTRPSRNMPTSPKATPPSSPLQVPHVRTPSPLYPTYPPNRGPNPTPQK